MIIDLKAPESWQEVTAEQLRVIAELSREGLEREAFLVMLLCCLTGMRMVKRKDGLLFRYEKTTFSLADWQLRDFCERLAFAFDEKPANIVCPFSWNRHLMDTTFGKWFHADAMMLRYYMTGETDCVKTAMADLGEKMENVSQVDIDLMQLWWSDFDTWLTGQYPLVFEKNGDVDSYSPVEARKNIMLMLNDSHPQDNERIEESNLHDVLAALQHKIEHAKEIEEQMSKYK